MQDDIQKIADLLLLELQGRLDPDQRAELEAYVQASEANRLLYQKLTDTAYLAERLQAYEDRERKKTGDWEKLQHSRLPSATRVHRVHFLRRWGWAAAVFILLLASSVLVLVTRQPTTKAPIAEVSKDVAPGGDKATLTLSDGTTITLDKAANGAIAKQGNAAIVKLANGQVVYNMSGAALDAAVMLNTMRTPKGGQYKLTLPDGTKVWLNAASSITYPAVFAAGKERRVKISGEVYFEVIPRNLSGYRVQLPFIVDVDDNASVEVLGTNFNVNAYGDDGTIKATLLEGSVKIKNKQAALVLKPGQQARVADGIKLIAHADIEKTMAWKNGAFNFDGISLQEAMKQLERWYDLEVIYEKGVPDINFYGEISRDMPLTDLLKALEQTEIHFRIEKNHRLVILP